MAELDRSVFDNVAERDRLATDFDAAYPVGLSWTLLEDRVVSPTITLGCPADLDRGILGLASADSEWSLSTIGSARWFPTFRFSDEIDETEANERIEAAVPGTIPTGAIVEAIIAELRLVALPDNGDDLPDDQVSQDEGERIGRLGEVCPLRLNECGFSSGMGQVSSLPACRSSCCLVRHPRRIWSIARRREWILPSGCAILGRWSNSICLTTRTQHLGSIGV